MAKRTNAHDLAPGLFQIIETVTAARHPNPNRTCNQRCLLNILFRPLYPGDLN